MQAKKKALKGSRKREKVFGEVLQEIRKQRSLSQEQLGFESGYHRNYIGMLERGLRSPSLSTIMGLADALQTPASEILKIVETKCQKQD